MTELDIFMPHARMKRHILQVPIVVRVTGGRVSALILNMNGAKE